MPTDFAFSHRVEVRFRDCDPMGHVNHAVYLSYLEQCRFAFWRHLTGAPAGTASGIIMARAECDYRAPAFFGELLEVRLKVTDIGRSSFAILYDITDTTSGRKLADARTVLVSYDYAAGKPTPISDTLRALLEGARQSKGSDMVTIFGKDSCPYTQAARDDYQSRGVPFQYINVKKNAAELERMLGLSKGRRAVPVIVADDGSVTIGFGGT